MNIIETIKKRKSCRTFTASVLKPDDKKELESYIVENSKGLDNEVVNFRIIEKTNAEKQMKIDYGMIKGQQSYILGTSNSSLDSRVNYGYLMERVVLKATEMNISTCWVGYFDRIYFDEILIENNSEIPSIVIIGYSEAKQSYFDKYVRFSVNASKRQSWEKIFFNYKLKTPLTPEYVKKYTDSLEMVRLAPSAGNTQPWRVFFDDSTNEFHFFKKPINKKYELRGLHDIDIGIALSHFELTALSKNLSGRWINLTNENIDSIDGLQYIRTWKCENL